MNQNLNSQSGIFNPRALLAFALCSAGVLLAVFSFAATSPSGMTGSAANSPHDSLSVGKGAGTFFGDNANAATAASWAKVDSPNAGSWPNKLQGVTCVTASDCWAVGFSDNFDQGVRQTVTAHYGGSGWTIVSSPNPSSPLPNYPTQSQLLGVTCASANDCWAVGAYHQTGQFQTLIEHWDGQKWTIADSANTSAAETNYLTRVTCASASDCWAVGYYFHLNPVYNLSAVQTLIEHWDGQKWTIIASPNTSAYLYNYLTGVTCANGSDCWAVGYYCSEVSALACQTLTEHYTGGSWAVVTSPNPIVSRNNALTHVSCASADDCWAVGYYNSGIFPNDILQTLIEHNTGSGWTIVNSPNPSATNNPLFGVSCISTNDCWTVGAYDNGSGNQTLHEHWDGTAWASDSRANPMASVLEDVSCINANDCWAAGGTSNGVVAVTLIEHYTASAPSVQLNTVVSELTHGSAGTFDIDLPVIGTPGIECRSGGANGDYTLVFTFANPLSSVGGANFSSGAGSISSRAIGTDAHQYIVDLTGVSNAQTITVSLTNVQDTVGNFSSSVAARMGVLIGDVNGDGFVLSGDYTTVRKNSGNNVDQNTFRYDINTDGFILSGDYTTVRKLSGTQLPPPPP